MKKKVLCIVLTMTVGLSLAGCGGSDSAKPATSSESNETTEAVSESESKEAEGDIAPATEETESDIAAATEETEGALVFDGPVTIYDENDVVITVNPIENKKLDITVENNSAADVNFKYDFIKVNDYQVNDSVAKSVTAGTTNDIERDLEYFFDMLGSEEVASFEIQGKLYDYATQTEIADIGDVVIQGENYGNEYENIVTDDAMLVYSDKDVLAYISPDFITTDVDFSLTGFTVNNSGAPVWCSAENFSFNGTPYDGLGDFETAAGLRKYDKIIDQFYYSWVGVSGADDIKTIDFDYTIGEDTVHVTLENNAGTLSVVK